MQPMMTETPIAISLVLGTSCSQQSGCLNKMVSSQVIERCFQPLYVLACLLTVAVVRAVIIVAAVMNPSN
jgi:hypothetical protein